MATENNTFKPEDFGGSRKISPEEASAGRAARKAATDAGHKPGSPAWRAAFEAHLNGQTVDAPNALQTTSLIFSRGYEGFEQATEWVIKRFIGVGTFGCMIGPSGSYKTFAAVDMACCVASGKAWAGVYKISNAGPVLYLAGEGVQGVKKRIKAWAQQHPGYEAATRNIFIHAGGVDMASDAAQNEIKLAIREIADLTGVRPALIVIDTLGKSLNGDENLTKDMRPFINGCQKVQFITGISTLAVHHTAKGVSRDGSDGISHGGRGSGALYDDSDFEIQIRKDGEQRVGISHSKAKDVEMERAFALELVEQVLATDQDGEPIISMAVAGPKLPVTERSPDGVPFDTNAATGVRLALLWLDTQPEKRGLQSECVSHLEERGLSKASAKRFIEKAKEDGLIADESLSPRKTMLKLLIPVAQPYVDQAADDGKQSPEYEPGSWGGNDSDLPY
ncbi:helicase RepA family protein [Enterobacter hormaechei]|uniref:AAA family ATPase n=2 Tax=Enterobacter TaxID=547 RepID=UPI000792E725|nr:MULTISPECIES: AAA family ATPase [Enterobacter cloacae complex]MCK6970913.1 helicase RepA family protein [Enterobacter cloacae]MCW4991306.1 helicase RepA family protein [Enterobacter hormaechei subsp. xiangfangensis]MCK7278002.1 helicase RepA family protein [Enterobacter hormaechei]MCL8117957.1 helicase RepA family protein [Enterobacter hormaechei]MCM7737698.1 helicase RepA family protein [Enterobacter hormaechei]